MAPSGLERRLSGGRVRASAGNRLGRRATDSATPSLDSETVRVEGSSYAWYGGGCEAEAWALRWWWEEVDNVVARGMLSCPKWEQAD